MGRYRTINTDLNRQYRNDLNANFAQIEQDILNLENSNIQEELLTELRRVERESKERDDLLAGESLDALIQSIHDAKNNANTSASNANVKATYAEEQGDFAKTQGDYARNQGDYAALKGDYANEKAISADEAAANANAEASNLSQLKVDTLTATQNANTASSNANNFAAYAQQQGDYAKQQAERAQDIVDGTGLLTQTDIGVKVAGFNANGQVLDKNGNVVEGKVKSVNGVSPDGTGNIPIIIPTKTSDITNNSGFITIDSVTKTQVGLGSVQNYGVATQAEAEAGTASNRYMTPQRTKQAIDKFATVTTLVKVTQFSRDFSLAGSQAITGLGFKPKAVMFITTFSGTNNKSASWGFDDGVVSSQIMDKGAADYVTYVSASLRAYIDTVNNITGKISSFDANGFTISWTKNGSPTGTVFVTALCIG